MDVQAEGGLEAPGDAERAMLRESVRRILAASWSPAQAAVPGALAAIGSRLAQQGLAELGTDPSQGGLQEVTLVMEELGRAACPAAVLPTTLLNLAAAGCRNAPDGLADLLRRLHAGEAMAAFAFGPLDPDPGAGRLTRDGSSFSGVLRFVDGAAGATALVVVIDDGRAAAIFDRDAPGITIAGTRALGADGLCEVTFAATPAMTLPLPVGRAVDLLLAAQLSLAARAHGAARRGFDLAVDYAKERKQFGQAIGRFQAIQHKLANCHIALEGVRLAVADAAARHDSGDADWRFHASAAFAFASDALRRVSLETHHAFGAIGYAEEHEAPRHFRRVHLDTAALGGGQGARSRLAALLMDGSGSGLPVLDLGAQANEFRDEVRAWLRQTWSGERRAAFEARPFHDREYDRDFALDLGKTGWIGANWPRAHGGQGRTPFEQFAFIEALEEADAPRIGAPIQASALMLFGTPAQRERYLPEILDGEAMYGMGYSEPDAGSDLASLRTAAVRDGDGWVINGQKIWTTTHWGQYLFVAARTDRDAQPPHAGISMFVVPTDAAGLTIKPSTTMYDGSFANCFLDDVRVPVDALVGTLNGGWKVLTTALATERGFIGATIIVKVAHLFGRLCDHLRRAGWSADPVTRDRLAGLAAEIAVGRQLAFHCVALAATDGVTPPEWGAISKVYAGELMERFGEAALDLLGLSAALSQGAPGALDAGRFEQALRHSLMWVISVGTNEIQRSLIAQRALGLPK